MNVSSNSTREQRMADGCCPNCGTRLYKISTPTSVRMPKLFKKKNSAGGAGSGSSTPDPAKMTPLTIPGVAERGQCVKCANGHHQELGGGVMCVAGPAAAGAGGNNNANVPVVKAFPVHVSPPPSSEGKKPPQSSMPVDIDQFIGEEEPLIGNGNGDVIGTNLNKVNLKHPPEDLLGLGSKPAAAAAKDDESESSSGSEESESESGSDDSSSSYETGSSLEEEQLVDLDFCRLESDHASSSLVNSLRRQSSVSGAGILDLDNLMLNDDDRKPAAKPADQIEESADHLRKLRLEAEAMDVAYLESTAGIQGTPTKRESSGDTSEQLRCPSGMSAEVFYELPSDMQKEVMEQDSRSNSNNTSTSQSKNDNQPTSAADIDPETLASLPDHIRQEVLEQARREQQKKSSEGAGGGLSMDGVDIAPLHPPKKGKGGKGRLLSESTTAFLSGCDISADDYENLPEDIKSDILKEKSRLSSSSNASSHMEQIGETGNSSDCNTTDEEGEMDLSGYDPEMLASLPEDVRKEVLEEERRDKERQRKQQKSSKPSTVGAHAVNNVPAGYDPETFAALPEEMQRELLDDAARQASGRQYSADGYDYDSIVGATVVPARPVRSGGGTSTSCTYTGEYNMMGKRHGDGELKWANGDKYVGKFKDGYIEGRGTINFHDGTEYAGQWKKNRFQGEGTRRFNNGNVYTGNYVSGKRQGQGKCYFANGDMYVGDWKEDTIHGFGRYYYNNGHSFEGMFRNGKRNGRGKYQLTDGRVEIYRYVNDSRVGDGVRWSANRKKAWRMNDGKVTKRVSIEVAAAIAKRCGPLVEES